MYVTLRPDVPERPQWGPSKTSKILRAPVARRASESRPPSTLAKEHEGARARRKTVHFVLCFFALARDSLFRPPQRENLTAAAFRDSPSLLCSITALVSVGAGRATVGR